ncbi:MAG: ABC transporter ATP-binding protein [Rhodospirillales bacterium]|nr:ABC transporter ATP-binding protein [Rhodospirillales bacterium]
MEPSIFKFIYRYSLRQQVFLVALTFVSFPFLYASLELPKVIVNEAIGSTDFPKPLAGVPFAQVDYLLILCFGFLLMVLGRFALRYYVNLYKGVLAERMLRRLRYQLFSAVLRFPLPHFRKTSQGEIIAMSTAEVEPLGGFIGDAVALPAFEGGTMLTILAFMFVQDPILGLAAISLIPVQAYVIPKLQRQINALAKERVRTVRKLSERLGEVVDGIEDVHAHDTAELERADIARWLGTIYNIRYKIYKKKFLIKFINNMVSQLTPFFFFSIGGYLVITGQLTFGALVAVLAAYKDLSSPWKELLSWYQLKEDSRIKYEQIIEQFQPAGMLPESLQARHEAPVSCLAGSVVCSNLTLEEEGGLKVVDGATFNFDIGERVALVGPEGAGTSAVAKLLARLLTPSAGSIRVGGVDLASLPQAVTGRRIGYVGAGVTLFFGSLRDNLEYGLRHQPIAPVTHGDGERRAAWEKYVREAREAGNTDSDPDADWVDYAAAGVADAAGLLDRTIHVLETVQLDRDLFLFGAHSTVDPEIHHDLSVRILEARFLLRERLQAPAYRDLLEPFDYERFNFNMSIAENILFGTPVGEVFDLQHIAKNPYMLSVLKQVGLVDAFIDIGLQAARIMVDLFRDVQPGDEIFARFSFVSAEAIPEFEAIIRRADIGGISGLGAEDRQRLLSVPFPLVPARHRLGLLDAEGEQRLLEARRAFAAGLPSELRDAVAFFDANHFNVAASVQDNILFGRLVYGRPQSQRVVGDLMAEVIDALDLRRAIIELGLACPVGIGGSRLSAAQRQKLSLARSLLKRPDLLVVDQAMAALDPRSQKVIMTNVIEALDGAGLVWTSSEEPDLPGFDRVIAMENGKIVGQKDLRSDQAEPPLRLASPQGDV